MPSFDPSQFDRIVRLHQAGHVEQAERAYRELLKDHPDEPNTNLMLGLLLFERGDYMSAKPLMLKAIQTHEDVPEWRSNYSLLCRAIGDHAEALHHIRRAVQLDPRRSEFHDNMGLVLEDLKRPHEAASAFRAAMSLRPGNATAHNHLAQNLYRAGRWKEAIDHWRRVIAISPEDLDARVNMGCALINLNEYGEAMKEFQFVLARKPEHLTAINNLAWVCFRVGYLEDAARLYREALAIKPEDSGPWMNLGVVLVDQGNYVEAMDCYRRALLDNPDRDDARSNLLLAMNYDATITEAQRFAAHQEFGRIVESRPAAAHFEHLNIFDPNRPLRVAYVSSDFYLHPVASFIESALKEFDRRNFVVSCYSSVKKPDRVTDHLRGTVSNWYDMLGQSHEDLARRVHDNREDILIDLTGHTGASRLGAFALRPAPIQITYLGYLSTTGMSTIDYRITDALADPPGVTDQFHSEKLLRLPCFFCYTPPINAPEVAPLPALMNGFVTFGSLCHPAKCNDRVLDLWAELLRRVPNSRLILSGKTDQKGEPRLIEAMSRRGFDSSRILVGPRQDYYAYLSRYGLIDIVLDPFPFNGHTTSCDALWMGPPIVTLQGHNYASRLTSTTLSHLGCPEWIAETPEQYLQIAMRLASDIPALSQIRQSMRSRMMQSPICNAKQFVANLEAAYRQIWRERCARA